MRFLRFFGWALFPLALFLVFLMVGLPHLSVRYSWRDEGQGYDPFARRYYVSCTYWGPYGTFTINYPQNGKCG
ncbi:MAG: hypothetical protein OIF54_05340, partial [Cohaesibacter sp.]|nr:hypothetical protein [Cohaesibacter sp.]